jgi:hypothetical protein
MEVDPTDRYLTLDGDFGPTTDTSLRVITSASGWPTLRILDRTSTRLVVDLSDPSIAGTVKVASGSGASLVVSNELILSLINALVIVDASYPDPTDVNANRNASFTQKLEIDAWCRGWIKPGNQVTVLTPSRKTKGTIQLAGSYDDIDVGLGRTYHTAWSLDGNGTLGPLRGNSPTGCGLIMVVNDRDVRLTIRAQIPGGILVQSETGTANDDYLEELNPEQNPELGGFRWESRPGKSFFVPRRAFSISWGRTSPRSFPFGRFRYKVSVSDIEATE